MIEKNVFHFVFCEDKMNREDKLEPFVYEMLQTNIPCIFVKDVPNFTIFLQKFDENQLITVWVHYQANSVKTDDYGRCLGENIGAKLIKNFPNLKFKYVTRAPGHPANSSDKKRTSIISLNDMYDEIEKVENFQKITDIYKSNQSDDSSVNSGSGGSLID